MASSGHQDTGDRKFEIDVLVESFCVDRNNDLCAVSNNADQFAERLIKIEERPMEHASIHEPHLRLSEVPSHLKHSSTKVHAPRTQQSSVTLSHQIFIIVNILRRHPQLAE